MDHKEKAGKGTTEEPISLEIHFDAMDTAVRANSYRLRIPPDRYETLWWQAHERLRAMAYHRDAAVRIIQDASQRSRSPPRDEPDHLVKSTTLSVSGTDQRLAFEMIAFLAAAKSSADFVATALSTLGFGATVDSVAKLEAEAARGEGAIRDLWNRRGEALRRLQLYRNAVLHRTTIKVHVKTVEKSEEGHVRGSTMAVILKDPPRAAAITRDLFRREEPVPFGETSRWVRHNYSDGSQKLKNYEFALLPPFGYESIHDFTRMWLTQMTAFAADALRAMEVSGFRGPA